MNPIKNALIRLNAPSDLRWAKTLAVYGGFWGALFGFSSVESMVLGGVGGAIAWGTCGLFMDKTKVIKGRESRLAPGEDYGLQTLISNPKSLLRVPVAAAIVYIGGAILTSTASPLLPATDSWMVNFAIGSVARGIGLGVASIAASAYLYKTKPRSRYLY